MERNLYNLKLLYIEDDEECRREMNRFLKRRFARVVLASNGLEGWEKFQESQPDLVITDLLMPEMGGMEMVEKIRERGSDCPVFITSALEDVDTILKTVDLGIVKYIIKPINTDELSDNLDRTAGKLIRRKNPDAPFGITKKKEIEGELRLGIASLLKKRSGKGPKDVSVFIGSNMVEIAATGTLTTMEETLLRHEGNRMIVEQNRRLFYEVIRNDIEELGTEALGCPVELTEYRVNPEMRKDLLVLSYFP